MSDVLHILHKLRGVHFTFLVLLKGTAVLVLSITIAIIDIGNVLKYIQPYFYAQLYIFRFLELKVMWQGLTKDV